MTKESGNVDAEKLNNWALFMIKSKKPDVPVPPDSILYLDILSSTGGAK